MVAVAGLLTTIMFCGYMAAQLAKAPLPDNQNSASAAGFMRAR